MISPPPSLLRFVIAVAFAAALACFGRSSWAGDRPTLAGTWTASPLAERFNIGDWGTACGPRPTAHDTPGGPIVIREDGAELEMSGAGRTFHTNECWEQLPGVARASHSVSERAWRTRCISTQNDGRATTLVTNIAATDTAISFDETGEYQFRVNGQNCTASARRTRNFTLVQRQGEAPASLQPQATATGTTPARPEPLPFPPGSAQGAATSTAARPVNRCEHVGDPVRFEVRPSRKLMRPGEHFAFRAGVTDANGCPVDARMSWTLATPNSKITVSPVGMVSVAADAEDGTADIGVSFAGKSVVVGVEIATPARYDALLSIASANDGGDSDQVATAVVTSGNLAANYAVAQDTARSRKTTFVIIIGTLALALAALGVLLLRRGSSAAPLSSVGISSSTILAPGIPEGPLPGPRPGPGEALMCPSCRNEFPAGSTFCPHDGNHLVAAISLIQGPGGAPAGGICPTCGRGYDPGVKTCPDHGDDLIPAAAYQTTRQRLAVSAARGKICPSCGGRYGGEATFCGKDGTALVLVN